ncbi:MAG: family 10 glycosylhydrolase, partial [Bacilli bacterium]
MKPIKKFNEEGYITYFRSEEKVMIPDKYMPKNEELRAVWFSTVANIDIPKFTDIDSYKEYLLNVIKKVKEFNMNSIIFQVRPANDAFYKSDLNPWSSFITGIQGKDPGFDIFEWFIEEARKEGLTIHAWINPYRVSLKKLPDLKMTKDEYLDTLADNNFARLNKNLVIETVGGSLILDPASIEVREFVSDSVLEIASNYDIKAVHIDDYFYPYEEIKD